MNKLHKLGVPSLIAWKYKRKEGRQLFNCLHYCVEVIINGSGLIEKHAFKIESELFVRFRQLFLV